MRLGVGARHERVHEPSALADFRAQAVRNELGAIRARSEPDEGPFADHLGRRGPGSEAIRRQPIPVSGAGEPNRFPRLPGERRVEGNRDHEGREDPADGKESAPPEQRGEQDGAAHRQGQDRRQVPVDQERREKEKERRARERARERTSRREREAERNDGGQGDDEGEVSDVPGEGAGQVPGSERLKPERLDPAALKERNARVHGGRAEKGGDEDPLATPGRPGSAEGEEQGVKDEDPQRVE